VVSPILNDEDLSRAGGAAALLVRNKERVLTMFVERVHRTLRDASGQSVPMIVDTLPAFLSQMARVLATPDPHDHTEACSTLAQQHGDERAKLTGYSLTEVIKEYQIVREILLELLGHEPDMRRVDWLAIHRSIDEAIAHSAAAFTQVHDRFRELFVAALSHDFRGPLGNAHNYLEILRRSPDHPQREHLTIRAMLNLRSVDRMIVELLDVTRRRAGERLPMSLHNCDANAIVREVVDEMRARAGDRFVLELGGPVEAYWGCERVKQAVHNLLENAVKYSRPDTPITVRVEESIGRVIIAVHNFGEPIPASEHPRLFKPFGRAEAAERSGKSGWGLGLVLVQAIAEAHGGSVSVDSAADRGTTFTLDILRDVRDFVPPASDPAKALT
jgi:signal transduction histidine kinase